MFILIFIFAKGISQGPVNPSSLQDFLLNLLIINCRWACLVHSLFFFTILIFLELNYIKIHRSFLVFPDSLLSHGVMKVSENEVNSLNSTAAYFSSFHSKFFKGDLFCRNVR